MSTEPKRKFPHVQQPAADADPKALANKALWRFLNKCLEDKPYYDGNGYGSRIFDEVVGAISAITSQPVDEILEEFFKATQRMKEMKKGGWHMDCRPEVVTWYNVDDCRPAEGEIVLGWHPEWLDPAPCSFHRNCWRDSSGLRLEPEGGRAFPTHWAKQPEGPKL